MNKKSITAAIIVVGLVVAGSLVWYINGTKDSQTEEVSQKKKTVRQPLNVIALQERPYLQIVPVDARNIAIVVNTLPKPADKLEFELEYQAGTLLQGAFGAINLSELPAQEKVLLGSCSAGGACTYHKDVKGGSLLTRYDGKEDYALKSDWRYFENTAGQTKFASKDAKFQIESPGLAKNRLLVVFNTAGYPKGLKGEAISDPYSLTSSSALQGEATVIMRAAQEGPTQVAGWDGSQWSYYDGEVEGKTITVSNIPLLDLYLVIH